MSNRKWEVLIGLKRIGKVISAALCCMVYLYALLAIGVVHGFKCLSKYRLQSFIQEHQVNDALLKRRHAFEQLVGGILHRRQLWFHGAISREESERRMRNIGLRDRLFLVRERTQVNSFALCLVYKNDVYHYLLDMNSLGQLSIENGRKFENLLQVVDHYSRTPDGLLCALGDVCPVTMFEESKARVSHGPRRIEDSELVIQGELGKRVCVYVFGCVCVCT